VHTNLTINIITQNFVVQHSLRQVFLAAQSAFALYNREVNNVITVLSIALLVSWLAVPVVSQYQPQLINTNRVLLYAAV